MKLVQLELIHLEEHQQHARLVEKENIQQQDHQVVQVVLLENMDKMNRIVNAHLAVLEHIQLEEHHNVVTVIQHVEGIVIQQMANVKVVSLDMDYQVERVQFVQVEHIQHQEQQQLVNHVHQFVTLQGVHQQQESVMVVMLDTNIQTEIAVYVEA